MYHNVTAVLLCAHDLKASDKINFFLFHITTSKAEFCSFQDLKPNKIFVVFGQLSSRNNNFKMLGHHKNNPQFQ